MIQHPLIFSIMPETATKLLLWEAQRNIFLEVLHYLKDKIPVPDSNPISELAPILVNDGIIRVGGRLKNAQISFGKQHPILLPQDHHVTILIIRHCHERVRHQGHSLTHVDIHSEGFHIVSGKRVTQQHINACILCRQLHRRLQGQIMADLPLDRLDPAPPFTNVGLDVFGDFKVKLGKATHSCSAEKKVWVVLFTCLSRCAIHLELMDSLDTLTFKNALRRFLGIRGKGSLFRSDKGKNFVVPEETKWGVYWRWRCHNDHP